MDRFVTRNAGSKTKPPVRRGFFIVDDDG